MFFTRKFEYTPISDLVTFNWKIYIRLTAVNFSVRVPPNSVALLARTAH